MLITDAAQLADAIQRLQDHPRFAIDTEFIREHSYRPVLCLVQIAVPDFAAAIDPQEVKDLTPIFDLVLDDRYEKIVHAGQQDMEIVYSLTGETPRRVFDTQVAAALVGLGSGVFVCRPGSPESFDYLRA